MDVVSSGPWSPAEVLALAVDARAAGAARRIAVPVDWTGLGKDHEALWGMYRGGSGAEPYQVAVSLAEPAYRCSCPSRQTPCKHGLALLLLWSGGHISDGVARPGFAVPWLSRRGVATEPAGPGEVESRSSRAPSQSRPPQGDDGRAAKRAERVARGLTELDRWLVDCIRGGLTAPALARYATWDEVAARLVDAQAPALANRVKRLAGAVGTRPGWHEHVLNELGAIHLLCESGRRLVSLDDGLADSVRTALGWTVRQADVLGLAPETDRWFVCGRSDTLEDRIVVRRWWLRGVASRRWCLLLGFAAYGQVLADQFHVGHELHADIHRYPGRTELRCVLGTVHAPEEAGTAEVHTASLAGAADEIGRALASTPWTERLPVTVTAAPTLHEGRWVLTDHTGSLPLASVSANVAPLVALSRGAPVPVTCEWTSAGLIPLAVHLAHRSVDLGPRGGFHERPFQFSRPGARR